MDFYTVSKKHAIKTQVPIEFIGISKGEKEGGIAEKFIHHIEVEGTIDNIPDKIEINMAPLEKGTKIHIKDLDIPENVKVLDDPEEVILIIKGQATAVVEEVTEEEGISEEDKAKVDEIFGD